jgi:predicted glycosyltransferase
MKFILRHLGLSKKYNYIVLAPEIFHSSMTNLIAHDRDIFKDTINVVKKTKLAKEDFLVKYRTRSQYKIFPTDEIKEIGYGNLIDFCYQKTIVIGYPGSAMIECFTNNITFFPFCDLNKFILNSSVNKLLNNFLYIATNEEELLDNIKQNKVFRDGYSKEDILHKDAKYLNEIVKNILNKNI